jgi:hypothetical protein
MNRPNTSSPTTEANAVLSPSRAAPHAKIAPDPPIARLAFSTSFSTCPNAGSTSSPERIRSGLQSPRTSTSKSDIESSLR